MSKQAVRKEKEAGPVEPAKATPSDKVDNEIRLEDLKAEVAQKVKEIQELEKAEAERKAEEERKAEAEAKEKRAKTDKLKDLAQSYEGRTCLQVLRSRDENLRAFVGHLEGKTDFEWEL